MNNPSTTQSPSMAGGLFVLAALVTMLTLPMVIAHFVTPAEANPATVSNQ